MKCSTFLKQHYNQKEALTIAYRTLDKYLSVQEIKSVLKSKEQVIYGN